MSEPQQNQDEELREFESVANKAAIEREHAMEAAERTCLELRIENDQLTKQRDAEISRAARIAKERDQAEAELAKRFPDIGPDPLKLDGDEWRNRGDISKVREVLNKAVSIQQLGVPDQTALVWRIDLSRLMDDHTVLASRWRRLKPALEKAEAACAELRNALLELKVRIAYIGMPQEPYWTTDHGTRVPDWRKHIAILEHALSSDCGKGWKSPEEYAALAKELQGEREHVEGYVAELDKHAWEKYHNDKNHNPAGWRCLAYNCIHTLKRQSVPASELDKTIEFLNYLERMGFDLPRTIAERDRLESLRKGGSK